MFKYRFFILVGDCGTQRWMVSLSIIPNNDMKIKKLLLALLFVAMAFGAGAQTKVGDNPQTIHDGSLLEMESLTKGLRLPRIVLNNASLWTLQGTTPANGMLIFNESGAEPKGLYYWNAELARWVRVLNKSELSGLIANSVNQDVAVRDSVVKAVNLAITNGRLLVSGLQQSGLVTDNVVLGIPQSGALRSQSFSSLLKSGTSISNAIAGSKLTTTINGVQAVPVAITNSLSSADNLLSSAVADGLAQTATIINSNELSAASGSLVSTINGVEADGVPVANGLTASSAGILLGGTLSLPTIIKTDAFNTLAISGLQSTGVSTDNVLLTDPSTGALKQQKFSTFLKTATSVSNTIGSGKISTTVNGVTGAAINIGNTLSMVGNTLSSSVGGGTSTADIITSNLLSGSADGKLTSTINGVTSTTGVLVNNGLNISATAIQLGGELLIPNTTITTTVDHTLSIKGLDNTGVIDDKVVVASGTDGLLKTINATSSNTSGTIVARDANSDFSARNITANNLIAGYQSAEVFNTTATILKIGGMATTLTMGADAGTTTLKGSFIQSGAGTFATGTGAVTLNGNVAITTGKVATAAATAELFNAGATTLNIGGAATTLTMGAATGMTTIKNNLSVAGATTITGATTLKTLAAADNADNVVTVAADGTLRQRVLGVTPFKKVTGDYTILMADNTVVLDKHTTGNVTFTLPATTDGVVVGTTFRIINMSNYKISLSASVRTAVDLQSGQILSGSTTVDGTVSGNKMTIMWDGSEWIQAGN